MGRARRELTIASRRAHKGIAVGFYPALAVGALGGSLSFLGVLFSPVRDVKSIPTTAEMGE